MMTFNDIQQALYELEQEVLRSTDLYPASDYGLDPRCGRLYAGGDFIATPYRKALDYYGGFEYIDSEYILSLQTLTIYSSEHERVLEALMALEHNHD